MKTYASFFEWSDKAQKELGVVEELIASLNCGAGLGLHSPQIQQPDPPDCFCSNASAERVGIEVAEVVCKKAARLNAQGQGVMRVWEEGELVGHISHRLKEKDEKAYHGGPYASLMLACSRMSRCSPCHKQPRNSALVGLVLSSNLRRRTCCSRTTQASSRIRC